MASRITVRLDVLANTGASQDYNQTPRSLNVSASTAAKSAASSKANPASEPGSSPDASTCSAWRTSPTCSTSNPTTKGPQHDRVAVADEG
jgi:hypothetical protein